MSVERQVVPVEMDSAPGELRRMNEVRRVLCPVSVGSYTRRAATGWSVMPSAGRE